VFGHEGSISFEYGKRTKNMSCIKRWGIANPKKISSVEFAEFPESYLSVQRRNWYLCPEGGYIKAAIFADN